MTRTLTRHLVGVVADTHCPEFLAALPENLPEVLAGVELIIHAGDVGGPETIAALERIAPVAAVRGDHDDRKALDLPSRRVVEVGGVRIGVVHGNRSRLVEEPLTLLNTFSLGRLELRTGLFDWLPRQLPAVQVVVYGHTHTPDSRRVGGTLLFNPGAVYQVTPEAARKRLAARPSWFSWTWLQVMRHRRRWPPPSIGLLEIEAGQVRSRVVPL